MACRARAHALQPGSSRPCRSPRCAAAAVHRCILLRAAATDACIAPRRPACRRSAGGAELQAPWRSPCPFAPQTQTPASSARPWPSWRPPPSGRPSRPWLRPSPWWGGLERGVGKRLGRDQGWKRAMPPACMHKGAAAAPLCCAAVHVLSLQPRSAICAPLGGPEGIGKRLRIGAQRGAPQGAAAQPTAPVCLLLAEASPRLRFCGLQVHQLLSGRRTEWHMHQAGGW